MINHFRTLALNVSAVGLTNPYTARNIHIDPSFAALPLPADLAALYNAFYPSSSLEAKLELTQAYMSLVDGCGLTEAMLALDPRVTYEVIKAAAPKNLRRISIGIPTTVAAEDSAIALRVFNYKYAPAWLRTPLSRTLSIEQQTNTNNVQVLEGVTLLHSATLSFSSGYSQVVTVPDPDNTRNSLFDFQIKHPTSPAFTSTSGKKWSVTFTVAYSDLIPRQFLELSRQSRLIADIVSTRKLTSAQPYDELWLKHFNEAYRLAGLYVSLIYRMNALALERNGASYA